MFFQNLGNFFAQILLLDFQTAVSEAVLSTIWRKRAGKGLGMMSAG
jgi:hypothetical protein